MSEGMASGPEKEPTAGPDPYKRWYDEEPVLGKALDELRQAGTSYQAQVSLNIMKVIVEHRLEADLQEPAEWSADTLPTTVQNNPMPRRRWYDADQTLQAALNLLQETPPDIQQQIIPSIAQLIEDALSKSLQPEGLMG
jgi:hypothetical protein